MPTTHTLLEQFRSFYYQNKLENIELGLELFAIFGGTSWTIDTNMSMLELIESKILKNYPYIHSDITQMTHSNKLSHALLSAIALGDRRIFSTFKRIRISREEGEHALGTLYRSGLLETEYSLERPLREEDDNFLSSSQVDTSSALHSGFTKSQRLSCLLRDREVKILKMVMFVSECRILFWRNYMFSVLLYMNHNCL